MLGHWNPTEINAELLNTSILEYAKQAFVNCRIPKPYLIKLIEKDLDGWKEKTDMNGAMVLCVTVTSVY